MVIKYGMPQGTMTGPLLFILNIKSLLTLNGERKIISFYDTILIYNPDDWETIKQSGECD